jgi:hypothetical protein
MIDNTDPGTAVGRRADARRLRTRPRALHRRHPVRRGVERPALVAARPQPHHGRRVPVLVIPPSPTAASAAQPPKETTVQILSKQPSVAGPSEWFTGVVYFDVIAPGTESRGKVNAVRFTPGAPHRLAPARQRADPACDRGHRPDPVARRRRHGAPPRRHIVVPTWRVALARRRPGPLHGAPGDLGRPRRRAGRPGDRVGRAGHRRRVRPLTRLSPRRNLTDEPP